jgi:hypothetical protein
MVNYIYFYIIINISTKINFKKQKEYFIYLFFSFEEEFGNSI